MSTVRVKNGVRASAWDYASQTFVTLIEGAEFDSKDPIVKSHAELFAAPGDPSVTPPERRLSVPVEQATANPGELRKASR